jgi:hypothetical protein
MSLLDIIHQRPEQLKAAARQNGRSRTFMNLSHEGDKAERDRELLRLRKKRFRARHPGTDCNIEKLRQWMANNRNKFKRAQRRWARANRDRINQASMDYRARKRASA